MSNASPPTMAAHDEIVDCIREHTRKEGDEPRAIS